MDLGIAGKVALVTGASKGIGRAIAAELVAEGAHVAVSSRSRERIEAAAAEVGARPFVHDSADLDGVPALCDAVAAALGPIEILVTNSGGPPADPDSLAFSREQWEAAHRELVLSPLALAAYVLPGMRARRFGRILNVGSSTMREPAPALMLSNTERSGVLAAFKTIARQVAGDGVTVNSLLPGRVATNRLFELLGSREAAERAAREEVPAGRLGVVEELASAAAFLCSDRASYITGVALLVDGGLTRAT